MAQEKESFSGCDKAGSQRLGEYRTISRELRYLYPDEEDWWVSDAFATRRSESIEEARKILLDGLAVHYDSAIIRYNLACYACVLGHPGECLDFLKEAVRRDEKYKKMAMEDEDLEAVREALKSMGWGQKLCNEAGDEKLSL